MTFDRDNLTAKQKDYAIFLPALSGFYATYVGKQRHDSNFVPQSRIPADFENGIEGLNWLNPDQAYFPYKWALYSAGHADLDINRDSPKEDMIRNRDRSTSFVVGDSGGFQIGKGVWEADWKDINCPRAQRKREQVLSWMDAYMDRGMVLDIPAWTCDYPPGRQASGVNSYADAVTSTYINNDYFMRNRNGNCKFLNVLQGQTHAQSDDWYDRMKKYCDPRQYETPFEGWAMGGQNKCDVHLTLRRLVALKFDGLLERGQHDWLHVLGTSKLEWACLMTDIQRAIRQHHNENFTISFDCASPFLATANGQVYMRTEVEDRRKWVYRMMASADDKKYAVDQRRYGDAVVADGIFEDFTESPVSRRLKISDVCIYKDGIRKTDQELQGEKFNFQNPDHYHVVPDLNKIGKIGRTSWDSFSYALQMGHNVWSHINAVQEANRRYDSGIVPRMLVREKFDRITFRQVVDEIFSTSDRVRAEALVDEHSKFWMDIPGSNGTTGKKTINSITAYQSLFEEVGAPAETCVDFRRDDSGIDEGKLDDLEMSI